MKTTHEFEQETSAAVAENPEAIRAELSRVLSSATFHLALRQRNFLRYIVEQTLEGGGHLLKEYSIGVEVFQKDPSFDPRLDTIVRTEARRLRSRLAKFYAEDGSQSELRIVLRKGSYIPAFEKTAQPSTAPGSAPASVARGVSGRNSYHRPAVLLLAIVVLIGLGVYAWRFLSARRVSVPALRSVAVLPFVNLSGAKNEYFSDGMTEELIDSLGRVRGLHVVGRASAFQFKGKTIDLREIGRRLNVQTVLEGSVRESNGKLRISVWLDDTSNGYRIWSQSFDREMENALAIQREISTAITNALGGKLGEQDPQSDKVSVASAAVNSEAYQDYLMGRYFWNRSTAKDIETAIKYFEQAITRDPNYASSYVGLAACYIAMPTVSSISSRESIPKIRAAGSKALALDSNLGEAHLDLAFAFEMELQWPAADVEFRRGLQLSPGSAIGHRWYAGYLAKLGRLDEALAEKRIAVGLDPVSLIAAQRLGEGFYDLRRYDEAIEQYQRTLAFDPNFGLTHLGLGMAYLQKGQSREAISELRRAQELMGGDIRTTAQLGYAYAVSGNRAAAQQILDGYIQSSQNGGFPSILVAQLYLGLGDRNRAFEWLSKALDEGESPLLKTSPIFDPLRSDPRFNRLLARLKLL